MNIETQMKVADEVLSKLKFSVDKQAIIAGGAPRNWEYDLLANDIDVYLRSEAGGIKHMLAELLGGDVEEDHDAPRHYHDMGVIGVHRIINVTIKECKFQFIVVSINEQSYRDDLHGAVIESFDTGVNRIVRQYGITIKSTDFAKDFNNDLITLHTRSQTDSQIAHAVKHHLPKMFRYFPEHTFKIDTGEVTF